ncbi:MAG TPA: hypothetical protein VFE46_12115 [Pirellulales bacterium]|jgi:hypothetical protein|nr:hypothetical protein [Pirellulales bacterium]
MIVLHFTKPMASMCLLALALRDHAGHLELGNCFLLLLLLAGGLWAAFAIWKRWYGVWSANHPSKLFEALCRAHKLDRNQQRLLVLLAEWHRLPHPGAMFLKPELLEASHVGPQFAAHMAQVQALRQRLFGAGTQAENSSQSTQNLS